jgi:hypothetical protein
MDCKPMPAMCKAKSKRTGLLCRLLGKWITNAAQTRKITRSSRAGLIRPYASESFMLPFSFVRRCAAKPIRSIAQVDGSGTAETFQFVVTYCPLYWSMRTPLFDNCVAIVVLPGPGLFHGWII